MKKMTLNQHYINLGKQLKVPYADVAAIREGIIEHGKTHGECSVAWAADHARWILVSREAYRQGIMMCPVAELVTLVGWTEEEVARKVKGILVYLQGEKLVKLSEQVWEVL